MKLLVHRNEKMFNFLRELQQNLHRPNDFAYEIAKEEVRVESVRGVEVPLLPISYVLDDVERDEEMKRYKCEMAQYHDRVEEASNTIPSPESVKQYIRDNYLLIEVSEWRYIGDGYFEVTGEYIK